MSMAETPEGRLLIGQIELYLTQGTHSQAERDARAVQLVRFLTKSDSHIFLPARYVVLWLAIAFVLGFFLANGFQR